MMEARASMSLDIFVCAEDIVFEEASLEVLTIQCCDREGDTFLLNTCSHLAHFLTEQSRALHLNGLCSHLMHFCV